MAEDDKSFVSRWSRLKRAEGETAPAGPPVEAETPLARSDQEAAAEEIDVEALVESLPDIESMTEESDFTVFLQKGVPQELKQRALRRLWRLNPVFANLDGLAEYDEDFTDAALAVKTVKTLYEVGKGMPGPKEPDEEDAETASEAEPETSPPPEGTPEGEAEPEAEEATALADGGEQTETAPADGPQLQPAEPTSMPSPQRGRAAQRRWGSGEG